MKQTLGHSETWRGSLSSKFLQNQKEVLEPKKKSSKNLSKIVFFVFSLKSLQKKRSEVKRRDFSRKISPIHKRFCVKKRRKILVVFKKKKYDSKKRRRNSNASDRNSSF